MQASGKGKTNVYSLEDVYLMALAEEFSRAGFAASATKRFWSCFGQLPGDVQNRARTAFERWIENPGHPGLRFRPIHGTRPIYSVRVLCGSPGDGAPLGSARAIR